MVLLLIFFIFFWQYLSLTVLTNCAPLMSSAVKIKLIRRESCMWTWAVNMRTWKTWMTCGARIFTFIDPTLPYRGKKVGEKWLNFLQVTKFFPDEIFPRLSFSQPVFFPDFFHLTKNLSRSFLSRIIIIISHLFAKNISQISSKIFASQCFLSDHLNKKTVNKTTCRMPSANSRELWVH